MSESLSSTLEKLEKPPSVNHGSIGETILRKPPRCRLNLDDAVIVIRNLSFYLSKTHESMPKDRIEKLVGKRVQKALLSF